MTTANPARVVASDADRPSVHPVQQWLALTNRSLRGMGRQGEFFLSITAPVFLTICFYIPLRAIMNNYPGMDYAQFLMPVICLQSVGFVATSAAMRAANDGSLGLTNRLRSMPVNAMVPLMARLGANMVLLVISLVWAVISGLVIGWRPDSGVLNLIGFFTVAFVVGMILAFGADIIGTISRNPEATSQALALPQLILGMLSTGFIPEERFPEWIQPFARNQPISQFTDLMRGFDGGTVTWGLLIPPLCWAGGVALVAVLGGLFVTIRSSRR
ncbi:ABC transporter permease [Williamsia sp. 1135]|uniref:ABC transporter permease n=1 Tax=Williamsia sp. 1135 TaxID=1889262 RepID=UPI000A0FA1DD|nr:ABC transporter permease [Williamsia sp. 1135]ORM25000.1 ABC transporter [Williamsia sp. 1135]